MLKKISVIAVAVGSMFLLSNCSTASTKSDEMAVHYNGGGTASKTFSDCVPASKHVTNGPGDDYYYYPIGRRTFSFTGADKNEERQDPLTVTTKDSQSVKIPGFIAFELTTDCNLLRKFHEQIGLKKHAYHGKNEDSTPDGWMSFLKEYIAVPLSATMNNAAGSVPTWQALYTSDKEREKLEVAVLERLPSALKKVMGDDYIKVVDVSFAKPEADSALLDEVKRKEKNKLANEAEAEKNKTQATKYDGFAQCLAKKISENACLMMALVESGKVTFYPVPAGGSVNVQPSAAK